MGSDLSWLGELGGFGALAVVLWLVLNRVMARQEKQDDRHAEERKEWGERSDRHVEAHRQGMEKIAEKMEQAIRELKQ